MKLPLPAVVLVAVASSLATVGAIELLRGAPAPSVEPPARPAVHPDREPRAAEALVPPPSDPDRAPDREARLAELERRVAALELGASARRVPREEPAEERATSEDELRDLVLGWVAEEREARREAAAREGEENQRKELEFQARYRAVQMAKEHGLAKWQEDEFAELFLETLERAAELEGDMDVTTGDPEEFEARWAEFDAWVEQRERELTARLDPELYRKIYGEDG